MLYRLLPIKIKVWREQVGRVYNRLLRPLGAVVLIGLTVYFFYTVRQVLTPFVLGFLVAYILAPFVFFLERYKIPRAAGIGMIYLLLGALLGLFLFYALPSLLRDLNQLVELIPKYTKEIQATIRDMQVGYSRAPIPESIRQVSDETIARLELMTLYVIRGFADGIIGLFSQTFNLVLAPILGFYFLMEYHRLGQHLLNIVPAAARPDIKNLWTEIDQVVKRFIRGNLLVAFLVAALAAGGMSLIGMDFPVLIGVMVGLTNFIPYFGAIISTVPVMLLALLKSKWLALYVLGVMVLIQQIEGNIISPRILGNCVGLHPLVIIFALLAAGQLWGLLGLVIAVPLAGVLKVLLRHFYLRYI